MAVYLDCNATTPIEPSVAALMMRFLEKDFGNPASPIHDYGLFARAAVEHARMLVGKVVEARPDEVIFTSGATESNNLAILGLVEEGLKSGRRHVITTAIEHKAVLEPLEELSRKGFEIEILPVAPDGRVNPKQVAEVLRPVTLLVSTMHVNNETGVVNRWLKLPKFSPGMMHSGMSMPPRGTARIWVGRDLGDAGRGFLAYVDE